MTMYDIDPPSPILHLSAPRKASQPTRLTDRQHLARIVQADPIAVRHSVGADVVIFRACGAVERVRSLRVADGDLALQIDVL